MLEKIFNIIDDYDQIIIYRHINPDLDAFGSQLGLYYVFKKMNDKNIVLQGDMTSNILDYFDKFDAGHIKDGKTLGIVVDTANRERIDGDISLCDTLIKIDHHIIVDSYGNINIEVENASSCSEIIALLFQNACLDIPVEAAKALYLGIIGDSNRFLYSATSSDTFKAAAYLLEQGVNISEIYEPLYMQDKTDFNVYKYIYNHYHQVDKIAYYYLSDDDLKALNITREQGSSYVNTLADFKEFEIWMAVTEYKEKDCFRVSLRSRHVPVNVVASHFNGGGHAFASGATLNTLDELNDLIEELKGIKEYV
ncbi:MAG: bifunctional oligoribonuclease/PAP phosphatase NrnA [Erysipelotrichaceae bacterium]|nr:bifunctional oligoribonuclease/PAP phosphatase NrnA [Erysipelotrichaceae bacterium]